MDKKQHFLSFFVRLFVRWKFYYKVYVDFYQSISHLPLSLSPSLDPTMLNQVRVAVTEPLVKNQPETFESFHLSFFARPFISLSNFK